MGAISEKYEAARDLKVIYWLILLCKEGSASGLSGHC